MGRWHNSLLKYKAFWLLLALFSFYILLKVRKVDLITNSSDIIADDNDDVDRDKNDTVINVDNSDNRETVEDNQFRFKGVYNGRQFVGLPFDTKWTKILENLNLMNIKNVNDEEVLKSIPVVVTAFSDNHLGEAMRLMEKLNKVHGDKKLVYVYDLGLSNVSVTEFLSKWRSMVLEFRQFKFELYPDYVKSLFGYRWKPLIIAEMFKTVKSFWWLDTSVQMNGTVKSLYEIYANCSTHSASCPLYPWIMPDDASHSVYTTTDKRLGDYLPYPEELMKNYTMYGANLMLIYGTQKTKTEVLRYLVLCALEKNCMAPEGTTIYCNFINNNRYGEFANCHRYDQSAVNILLAWANSFNISKYTHNADNAFQLY